MLVLSGLVALAAVIGWRALFSPLPGSTEAAGPTCTPSAAGAKVKAGQVTVSVFNAGSRAGLAEETLAALEQRDFKPGQVGNAPEDAKVKVVQVWTTARPDRAAKLVALQFGQKTVIRTTEVDLGPGVDVLVGDGFTGLVDAPSSIRGTKATDGCTA